MTPQPTTDNIPILPGHYRQTMVYFIGCILGLLAGGGIVILGLDWHLLALQITGGAVTFISFLCLLRIISRAQTAPCPVCATMMSQGWDDKQASSTGIFTCPQCQSRWRTRAVWGFE